MNIHRSESRHGSDGRHLWKTNSCAEAVNQTGRVVFIQGNVLLLLNSSAVQVLFKTPIDTDVHGELVCGYSGMETQSIKLFENVC